MISKLHDRLGTAGLVVAIVALVVALTGTAFAALPGLNSKQKKEVKNIAKQFPGAPGAPGAPGPAGPTGPQGAQGPAGNGTPGENGKTVLNGSTVPAVGLGTTGDFYIKTGASPEIFGPKTAVWGSGIPLKGTNGAPGAAGKTILNGTGVPAPALGEEGDFYLDTAATKLYGPKTAGAWGSGVSLIGAQGPEGNIKATLPPSIQMKGTWTAGPFTATGAAEPVFANVSFNIPTSTEAEFFVMKEGQTQSPEIDLSAFGIPIYRNCGGGASNPAVTATSNFANEGGTIVCLFTSKAVNWDLEQIGATFGVGGSKVVTSSPKLGAVFQGESTGAGASYAYGTWVVMTLP